MSGDLTIASDHATRPVLDAQLRRYHRSYRRRLRKLAHSGTRMRDLIFSFPAAAFTLAGAHVDCQRHTAALSLVHNGAGLRDVAQTLALPPWSRRLPPEAFVEPIGALPTADAFARRIVNQTPKDPRCCAMWFQWVKRGSLLCDDQFALWIARQGFWHRNHDRCEILQPLAAYAWFSKAGDATALHLMDRRWTPKMRFASAVALARDWLQLRLVGLCDPKGRDAGRWLDVQRCRGFEIVPLRTPAQLEQEGRRMDHCVGDYADEVASGECLIYSIRRGVKSVATVEILPRGSRGGQPRIAQLRGPRNEDVNATILSVVDAWLSRQGPYPFANTDRLAQLPPDDERWVQFWSPYRSAKSDCGLSIQPAEIHQALRRLTRYV